MRVRVLDEKYQFISDTNPMSPIVAELHAGDELTVGKTVRISGAGWCAARLPDGKTGYVAATVEVFQICPVALAQSSAEVFESPPNGSKPKSTFKSGDRDCESA
jgi:hypothetical protein